MVESGSTPIAESTTLAESTKVLRSSSSSSSGLCASGVLEPSPSSSWPGLLSAAATSRCEDGLGGTGDVASEGPDLDGSFAVGHDEAGGRRCDDGRAGRAGFGKGGSLMQPFGSFAKLGLALFAQELSDHREMSGSLS